MKQNTPRLKRRALLGGFAALTALSVSRCAPYNGSYPPASIQYPYDAPVEPRYYERHHDYRPDYYDHDYNRRRYYHREERRDEGNFLGRTPFGGTMREEVIPRRDGGYEIRKKKCTKFFGCGD